MENKFSFSSLIEWLKSTEMFERPSKKLPGKWSLLEYYFEPENELINIKEDQIEAEKLFWNLEFGEDEKYLHNTNLKVPLVRKISAGTWSRTRNFITIIHPKDFRNNVEFQFAIEKNVLKLLKKDAVGKIEFFGFFRKLV